MGQRVFWINKCIIAFVVWRLLGLPRYGEIWQQRFLHDEPRRILCLVHSMYTHKSSFSGWTPSLFDLNTYLHSNKCSSMCPCSWCIASTNDSIVQNYIIDTIQVHCVWLPPHYHHQLVCIRMDGLCLCTPIYCAYIYNPCGLYGNVCVLKGMIPYTYSAVITMYRKNQYHEVYRKRSSL